MTPTRLFEFIEHSKKERTTRKACTYKIQRGYGTSLSQPKSFVIKKLQQVSRALVNIPRS